MTLLSRLTAGPTRDPLAWAGPAATGAFLAGTAAMMARSEHPYPRPGSLAEQVEAFFGQPSRSPRFGLAGQAASAAALAGWTAAVARLARPRRGEQTLAIAGGALAAGALAASATRFARLLDLPADPAHVARLHRQAFIAGGPVHGVGFGALLAALGLAGRRTRRLSQPLARAALIAAVPNLASPIALVWPPGAWLLPVGRFPGLVVTAVAGVRLAT
jgi:hypothetical protein